MPREITLDREFYAASSLAIIFDVEPYTARKWIIDGKFPNAFKLNGRWRVPKQDVVDFANQEYGE